MLLGLKDEKLKPPGPGETSPESISAMKTPTSMIASASITLIESAIPNSVNSVTQITRIAKIDPPRDVPAVLRLQRVVHERAGERADDADRDRVVQEVQPRREPAEARTDRAADVEEVAAGAGELLGELGQDDRDAEADDAAEQVRDRRRHDRRS